MCDRQRFGRVMLVVSALCAAGASLARAGNGPLNTPVTPFLSGRLGRHVWTVSGALKRNGMVTSVSCTSLDPAGVTADIGVEFFDGSGTQLNSVSTDLSPNCNGGVLGVAAGSSVTIANGATAQFHEDCVVGLGTFAGSARIVSTSTKIACTAQIEDSKSVILDTAGNPTGRTPAVSKLTLTKRNKQLGD